jgi:hypothetical protein
MLTAARLWLAPNEKDFQAFVANRLRRYLTDDIHWAFPRPPGADLTIHPLVAWRSVLFTLSMLARYHPASWIQHLDVGHSTVAQTSAGHPSLPSRDSTVTAGARFRGNR